MTDTLINRITAAQADAHGEVPDAFDEVCDVPAPDMTPERFAEAVTSARPGVEVVWVVSGVVSARSKRYSATVYPVGGGNVPARGSDFRTLLLDVLRVTSRQDRL